ncbi:hypothetical protein BDY24DRAFT_119216 [Mrakia frigida]|uniref:uncharacterized protein n=1 Tax=Mrakia frigida TaxID=29902 RepID=UPI003FCC04FB
MRDASLPSLFPYIRTLPESSSIIVIGRDSLLRAKGKFCTRCWRLLDDQKPGFLFPPCLLVILPSTASTSPPPSFSSSAKSLFLSTRRYRTILVTTLPSTLDLSAPSNVDGGVEGGAVLCELTRWSGSAVGTSSFGPRSSIVSFISPSSKSNADLSLFHLAMAVDPLVHPPL